MGTLLLDEYDFTPEEAKDVEPYFYDAKLRIDCLGVAYVSDRKDVEDRLLRPTKGASQQGDTSCLQAASAFSLGIYPLAGKPGI